MACDQVTSVAILKPVADAVPGACVAVRGRLGSTKALLDGFEVPQQSGIFIVPGLRSPNQRGDRIDVAPKFSPFLLASTVVGPQPQNRSEATSPIDVMSFRVFNGL